MILSGESSAKEADGRNPHESCSRRKVPCGLSGITVSTCHGERSPNDPAQPGPPACAVFACCGGRSGRVRASRTIPTMHPLPCRAREFYRGPCLWKARPRRPYGPTPQPAIRLRSSGQTLKSGPDTCLVSPNKERMRSRIPSFPRKEQKGWTLSGSIDLKSMTFERPC